MGIKLRMLKRLDLLLQASPAAANLPSFAAQSPRPGRSPLDSQRVRIKEINVRSFLDRKFIQICIGFE
jgi:hypothetical protein